MKLKFLFLGMFAAALMMSCNNEGIDNGPVVKTGDDEIVESKGIPTYVALDLQKDKVNTRAGQNALSGHIDERNVGNVAVFVYKMDVAQNTFPENYAYVGSLVAPPVLMKTTDGTKKVYLALNVGSGMAAAANIFNIDLTPANIPTEGAAFATPFNTLNRVLWSNETAGYAYAPVTTASGVSSSNGLIKSLAGGTTTFTKGLLVSPLASAANDPDRYYLMSNWDNPNHDIAGTSDYESTCKFTFAADIPKTSAPTHTDNAIKISVQRAVAKTTLKFSSSIVIAGDGYSYLSDGNDTDKGAFKPWGRTSNSTPGIFAAGNINKETSIFQKFDNGSVSDDNYGFINCHPDSTGGNLAWYTNFDNIRVFGADSTLGYGRPGNTVSRVRSTMTLGTQNPLDSNSYKMGRDTVYLIENAQSFPAGYHDNSTFLIMGGEYIPRSYISTIQQAAVVTNPPIIACNGATIPSGTPAGTVIPGVEYSQIVWPAASGVSADTLYYHIGMKLFFYGKANLYKYYAWVEKKDTTSNDPASGRYGPGTSPSPETDGGVIAAINADFKAKVLVSYFQGNCFYRMFIKDDNAVRNNESVLIRRNHIYDVTISKILGPGIADPNDILIPGQPVNPVDTYIAITIEIQDWHKVDQFVDVDGK